MAVHCECVLPVAGCLLMQRLNGWILGYDGIGPEGVSLGSCDVPILKNILRWSWGK